MKELKLVKGVFAPEEAKDVLFKLIDSKIKFHQLEKFSLSERNKNSVSYTDDRIHELQSSKKQIEQTIKTAILENKLIKLDGTILLEFIDKNNV